MTSFFKAFVVSIVLLSALDFLWLGFIVKNFNDAQLAPIARMAEGQVRPWILPAAAAYVVMAIAMTVFVFPRLESGAWLMNFAWGAALGFCLYALFDLTNLAILKDYPLAFACVDVAWGTTLYGLTATLMGFALSWTRS